MPAEGSKKTRRWRRWLFVVLLLSAGLFWLSGGGGTSVEIEDGSFLFVDIGGGYDEQPVDDLVARIAGDPRQSLVDLLLLLRAASDDSRVEGLVVRIRNLDIGWAKAQELRAALARFRANGGKLVAYLENEFGNSTLEYFVASVAESVYVPPAGSAAVSGLLAEYVFLGGLWEKLDIDMQVIKIGAYKSAGDLYANREMSAAHREMANSLLDSIYGQFLSAVATSRGLDEDDLRELIDRGPMTVDDLLGGGLIDGTRFLDEIEADLVGDRGAFVEAADYDSSPTRDGAPVGRVAIVFGVGTITTGPSADGVLSDDATMGADTMRDAFEEVAEDEEVDAIVFRVDSPGGSALASDLIWHATQQARMAKPVVVSMSDVAGSGGYYVSSGASRILADPGTLTGSIGVVLAKPNVRGLLEKFGIHSTTVRRGHGAGAVAMTESFDEAELRQVRASMQEVYRLFVERVASGRSMDSSLVDEVGRGRVWTGEQAVANGLVDRLGGLLDAIDEAKVAIGVDPEAKVEVVFYPRQRGLFERLAGALSVRVGVRLPRWWGRLRQLVAAHDFPAGTVLTLMPQRVVVR